MARVRFSPDLFKSAVQGIVNPWLVRLCNRSDYDIRRTLVIAGYPRSGTTWLAELVATLPGTAILFEPDSLQQVPAARAAGFDWDNFHLPGEEWPAGEEFLRAALAGRVLNHWTTSYIPLARVSHVDRWVVKFVRVNQMLAWLTERFQLLPPVFLIRHPCAVYASWVSRGWPLLKGQHQNPKFLQAYPRFREVMAALRTPEEFFAAKWCMENFAPLATPAPRPFQVVAYERLRKDCGQELHRIFKQWGMEMPAAATDLFRRPSAKASVEYSGAAQRDLGEWRSYLDDETVDRILGVVTAFGLDFYGRDPEPDYDRLMAFVPA